MAGEAEVQRGFVKVPMPSFPTAAVPVDARVCHEAIDRLVRLRCLLTDAQDQMVDRFSQKNRDAVAEVLATFDREGAELLALILWPTAAAPEMAAPAPTVGRSLRRVLAGVR